MYQPEQELVEITFKDLLQKFVAVVSWTSAIAVDQKELLAFDGLDDRLAMHLKPQFVVQVTETPKVVVADEHVHRNARIGELGQLALQPDEALGNHGLILKPKIEEVTHKVKLLAVGTNHVQEAQQLALALLAVLQRGNAQMKVGDEIDGHQNWISFERRMSSVIRVMSLGSTAFTALMTSSCVMVTGWSKP